VDVTHWFNTSSDDFSPSDLCIPYWYTGFCDLGPQQLHSYIFFLCTVKHSHHPSMFHADAEVVGQIYRVICTVFIFVLVSNSSSNIQRSSSHPCDKFGFVKVHWYIFSLIFELINIRTHWTFDIRGHMEWLNCHRFTLVWWSWFDSIYHPILNIFLHVRNKTFHSNINSCIFCFPSFFLWLYMETTWPWLRFTHNDQWKQT